MGVDAGGVGDGDATGLAGDQVHVVGARAPDGDAAQGGQAASTRSVKRACARMLKATSASPMRSIRVCSWSAPRRVNTRTWPSVFSGASATEPVRAGRKS